MDLRKDSVKALYTSYLIPSLGGALATSIYSFVDTIAVGQAMGPDGAAATAITIPLFSIASFLGILCGVGGSVMMSQAKGAGKEARGNAYFTASLIAMGVLTAVFWVVLACYATPILTLFGAKDTILPLAMDYTRWIIYLCPFLPVSMYLGCIIRNDNAPKTVMCAVLCGGVVNIFGDWLFVFPLGMGMGGAALATMLGTVVQTAIMCGHFASKKCGLRLVKAERWRPAFANLAATGFGASVLDIAIIVLTAMLNNQVMRYGGTAALAVFGVMITISSLFQHLFSGVGQAIQPIVSVNFGAGETDRIRQTFRKGIRTSVGMGILFTAVCLLFPKGITQLFMSATPEVLEIAPEIVRTYALSFLLMGVSIVAIYYLQSIMRTKISMTISLLRGIAVSGALIYLLPLCSGIRGVWWAMVITEVSVAIFAMFYLRSLHRSMHHADQVPSPLEPA